MGRRYSDIRRATQLKDALDNYVAYLSTPRAPRLNTRGARDNSKVVFLAPFTTTVADTEVIQARVNPAHFTKLGALINGTGTGAEVLEANGTKNIVDLGRFSAARVVLFQNATRSVTVSTSDVTRNQYLKYAGERFSCPFGQKTTTSDMIDAYLNVKAAVLASTSVASAAVKRVSLIREKASAA